MSLLAAMLPALRGERLAYAKATVAAYRQHARQAIANWSRYQPSAWLRQFVLRLPPSGRVLDYGCGIGMDAAWMRRHGLQVEGIDGTPAFVQEARRRCPGAPITCALFERVQLPPETYDGVWCQAALIHVPPEVLALQLRKLQEALKPAGCLALSLAWGRRKAIVMDDWIPGRYIASYSKTEAQRFFRQGWTLRACQVTGAGSRQGRWIHLLAERA